MIEEATLEQLAQAWVETWDEMNAKTETLRKDMATVQDLIDGIEEPFIQRMGQIEEAMIPLVSEGGVVGGVQVKYRSGYDRVVWNGKALEGYAVADPKILSFREVKKTAPSVRFERAK
jgi:hypothetical protein